MQTTVLLLFFIVIAAVQSIAFQNLQEMDWKLFQNTHKKSYDSKYNEKYRKRVYFNNMHKIKEHNKKYDLKKVSYKLAMNKYGDMLNHEFSNLMNGYNKSRLLIKSQSAATFIPPANVQLPKEVDWRDRGAVTGVKSQGPCGSCWAFSATGSLEGQHFRKTDILMSLSEQNLIDCSGKYGNDGCNGGLMDLAFQYVKANHGLDTEESYPYQAIDASCRYNPKNKGATDVGYVDLPEGDEEKLMAAVATIGPISVAIDASHSSFQFYSDGVYDEPRCSKDQLDHGVLVVGYGTERGIDYWLVKNSWGTHWGNKGYIKMIRNKNNHCGIASSASYPLV